MTKYHSKSGMDRKIFVGIDGHFQSWHITVAPEDAGLFKGIIPAGWDALEKLSSHYHGSHIGECLR